MPSNWSFVSIPLLLACSFCSLPAFADAIAYDNTAHATSVLLFNNAVTQNGNTIANMDLDDIHVATGFAGATVTQFSFIASNPNGIALVARPVVAFWAADGIGDAPGTFLTSFTLPDTALASGATVLNSAVSGLIIPDDGKFWAGIAYDDHSGATGATAAQIGLLGALLGGPPRVGNSDANRAFFISPRAYPFAIDNPSLLTFKVSSPLNYGWAFRATPVPEPTLALLVAVGLAACAYFRTMTR
ncbi:MAG: hypothetical protein ABI612_13165 [Betaproteobacteria bacterium]